MTIGIVGLPHYFPDGFFIDTTMDKKYVVYQHVTPDGMYYFGQTQNVERRWSNNGAEYKRTALQPYIEKFGWDNIKHIVLFRDQTKEDALWIENFLIETAREDGVCINQRRSGLISKEEGYRQQYYQQNREKELERNREYHQKNREKRLEQRRQRYQKNREKELEYYQKNRDEILEQRKQRYQKNREKELEYYQKNRDEINERRRQRYQRKKEEKQFKELGNLPLW